jgi:Zn-dependent alcohol dehydrogenase
MGTTAKVVVLPQEEGPLRIEEIELPAPGPHQVVVRQFASGICHSQLHQMHSPRSAPAVLGHESTGVVTAIGSAVTEVAEGDRVMVTWISRRPLYGRTTESAELKLTDGSVAVAQGVFTWADTTICDEMFVVPLPDGVPTDVTAIVGCAVMTGSGAVARTAEVKAGQSVAVFGVGGVGLSAIAAAAAVGADPIIAVDLDPSKLDMAKAFGATHGIDASKTDAVEAIRQLTSRPGEPATAVRPAGGVDYAFDCIGVKATMEQLVPAVRFGVFGASRGGVAVLVGVPTSNFEMDARQILLGEKTFRGSIGGSCIPERDFPMFLRWYEQKKLDLDALVTRRYSIEQINEATTALQEGQILGRAILEFEH